MAQYRFVLIDCAPSLGPTTRSGMVAADGVLMVVELSALSVRGAEAVMDTIEDVGSELNQGLDLVGVVVNREPPVSAEADRQVGELDRVMGRGTVWRPFLPQRTVINEAVGHRCPVGDLGLPGQGRGGDLRRPLRPPHPRHPLTAPTSAGHR